MLLEKTPVSVCVIADVWSDCTVGAISVSS